MNDPQAQALSEITFDAKNLYREEIFTDLKVGSLKQLTPMTADGERDLSRPVIFMGETQLMSQLGPLPVQVRIDADSLSEAINAYPEAIKVAVEAMIDEVKELQRKEMSRIVVPGAETTSKIVGPK
ncbi:MAG: hypothetical protein PVG92_05430 [Holophagae bacterium]|jgi:hypothetical protein